MLILFFLSFAAASISLLMLGLTFLLSEKSIKEREKMTPFECGFSPYKKARSPFSLRFFITTLIFLIFDMEIALVLPMGVLMKISSHSYWVVTSVLVIFILLVGLLHEWKAGALDWVK